MPQLAYGRGLTGHRSDCEGVVATDQQVGPPRIRISPKPPHHRQRGTHELASLLNTRLLKPHRDTSTQMRRLHQSPAGPHPHQRTQPLQHPRPPIIPQTGTRTRPLLRMPRQPRARRLRQTQGTLRQTKHDRRPLPLRAHRTHRHASQPQRPTVRTRPVQTMPRHENRQHKTIRLQHSTVKPTNNHRTTSKHDPQHPRGVG